VRLYRDQPLKSAWAYEQKPSMQRANLNDLLAFLAVGRERSFTKAAAKLVFLSPRSAIPFVASRNGSVFGC
jgi:hypothetical protein